MRLSFACILCTLACGTQAADTTTTAGASSDASASGDATAGDDVTDDAGSGAAGSEGTESSSGAGPGESSAAAGSDGDSSAGVEVPEYEAVFAARCSVCHGDDAEGVTVGPSTGPEIRHAHPLMLAWIVRHGDDNGITNAMGEIVGHPGTMTAFDTDVVSDAVLDDIDAWLQSFPQASDGQGLFEDHCSFCHGMSGASTTAYVSPYHNLPFTTSGNTDTLAEFIAYVRAGHVVDDMGNAVDPAERREYMPPFSPAQLSDAQLGEIEAWVRTQ